MNANMESLLHHINDKVKNKSKSDSEDIISHLTTQMEKKYFFSSDGSYTVMKKKVLLLLEKFKFLLVKGFELILVHLEGRVYLLYRQV